MDYIRDPLYQWYCKQVKTLQEELDRTNRRLHKRRMQLRQEIDALKDKKRVLRGERPQFLDYGMF